MLTRQLLTLTLAATVSVPGANGQALEESMTLPFALTASKALVTSPKPFIEVSSTEGIYISEGNALTLADTQCLHTETPQVQLCFGNRWPTRVRLLPHGQLRIGLHSLGLSLLAYIHNPSFVTEALFPGQDALPELNSVARAIVTKILQGIKRQGDIIENARQRSLMLSHLNNNSNNNNHHKSDHTLFEEPLGKSDAPEESAEEDSDPIEWWGFAQPPAPDTNDNDIDLVQVRLENDILLKPDIRYCFIPDAKTKHDRQTAPNEGSGSEGKGSSDENSDSDSDEENTEAYTDSEVQFIGTTMDPFPVSREIREYCAILEQRKIKQEPISDNELPTGSEVEVAAAESTHKLPAAPPTTRKQGHHSGKQTHSCKQCGKMFAKNSILKKHLRIHSGEKPHLCQVCGKAFAQGGTLMRHLRTHSGEKPHTCQQCDKAFTQSHQLIRHLRTHSGEKPYRCQQCGKAFAQSSHLRVHQRTHSGEKPHTCQQCDRAFYDSSSLKIHQRTHSGEKPYLCQQCGKTFAQSGTLKRHLRTHSGEKPYLCQQCGKTFAQNSHLKKHLRTHKTAGKPSTKRRYVAQRSDNDL